MIRFGLVVVGIAAYAVIGAFAWALMADGGFSILDVMSGH